MSRWVVMGVWVCLTAAVWIAGWTPEAHAVWPDQDVAVVLHTCDDYARYWPGLVFRWHAFAGGPAYLATEQARPPRVPATVQVCHTGPGPWAQRLQRVLEHLSTPYVLYLQEDAWLTAPLTANYLHAAVHLMQKHQLLALKLYEGCAHAPSGSTTDVQSPRWYIVAHQPTLWRRDFLRSTLYADQDALRHEVETNLMLHRHPEWAQRCGCFSEFDDPRLSPFPYAEVSRRGEWLPVGRRLWAQQLRAEKPRDD